MIPSFPKENVSLVLGGIASNLDNIISKIYSQAYYAA